MGKCAKGVAVAGTTLVVGSGLVAALGAASGAIGAEIFNNSYPDWTDITTSEFVNAMVVGELILSAVPLTLASCVIGLKGADSFDSSSSSSGSSLGLVGNAVSGVFAGMLGVAVLGLIENGSSDVGFAAAAGGVGASIASLAIGTVVGCCILPCVAAAASHDAEPPIAPVQKEIIRSDKGDLFEIEIEDERALQPKNSSMIYSAASHVSQSFSKMLGWGAQQEQEEAIAIKPQVRY